VSFNYLYINAGKLNKVKVIQILLIKEFVLQQKNPYDIYIVMPKNPVFFDFFELIFSTSE